MTISIGNHSKLTAGRADQPRIRTFYRDVLGCELTKQTPDVDYIKLGPAFHLAVLYQDVAPAPEVLALGAWLELVSPQPEELGKRVLDFGVHRFEIPGADHLYFQAPGGQVFRIVRQGEDLSRFEH